MRGLTVPPISLSKSDVALMCFCVWKGLSASVVHNRDVILQEEPLQVF